MARKRDIIIAVVIGTVFLMGFVLFGFMFIGLLSGDRDISIAGLGSGVGVLEISGVLVEKNGREFIEQLDRWKESGSVDAIVLHINSPGGGVAISQEIYDAVRRVREEKPVVASMASVAASGGYYIACGADQIMANPGTITGSIGVIFQFHTFNELLEKMGIGTETVKSGSMKDVGSYAKKMSEKERLMLKSVVMDTYEQFIEAVAESRQKPAEDIYPLADGSIYTGLQAYNLGLVDELGGLNEAIQLAAEMAGISGEPRIIKPRRRERSRLFDLLGSFLGRIPQEVTSSLNLPQLMYLYR